MPLPMASLLYSLAPCLQQLKVMDVKTSEVDARFAPVSVAL